MGSQRGLDELASANGSKWNVRGATAFIMRAAVAAKATCFFHSLRFRRLEGYLIFSHAV